jgi:hypothetical protein
VHKREIEESALKTHLCNSPVYDEITEAETLGAVWPTIENAEFDEANQRTFKDEGIFLEHRGSYHMYHRLDGKLVAFGNLDFL